MNKSASKRVVVDHRGNKFESLEKMCKHWGIKSLTYKARLNKGMTVQEALETPVKSRSRSVEVVDHLGNKFTSGAALCRYWKIDNGTYRTRIKAGWSMKETLETPVKKLSEGPLRIVRDHLGNEFGSISEMCDYWRINYNTFNSRIDSNMSLKDALETPVASILNTADHLGKWFSGVSAMCGYWGIYKITFEYRILSGISLKDALEIPDTL